jgi:hypothetical protein
MAVFAAIPWTYWLAPLLLVIAVLALLGFGLVYLKKVVEPRYSYLGELDGLQRSVDPSTQLARAPRERQLAA